MNHKCLCGSIIMDYFDDGGTMLCKNGHYTYFCEIDNELKYGEIDSCKNHEKCRYNKIILFDMDKENYKCKNTKNLDLYCFSCKKHIINKNTSIHCCKCNKFYCENCHSEFNDENFPTNDPKKLVNRFWFYYNKYCYENGPFCFTHDFCDECNYG